jgi:hypothetical protein
MGFGVSLILIAAGLIMALAVNVDTNGFNLNTIGWIVAAVGAAGLILSMIFWNSWAGPGYWAGRRRTTYVDEGPPTY